MGEKLGLIDECLSMNEKALDEKKFLNIKNFRESFTPNSFVHGKNILKSVLANKIATDIGFSDLKEMQKLLGLIPDGKFGPKTFESYSIYCNLVARF